MKPKHLLFIILTLAIFAAFYILADSFNLGGLSRTPTPTATNTPTSTATLTSIPTATQPPTTSPSSTSAITATVTPVLGVYFGVETGTSVVHLPNLARTANRVEMRLERFDIMPSSVVAYMCFDKPPNSYESVNWNWTIGQSSLQVGRVNGQMETSILLFDATENYIAENFIPAFGPMRHDSRCEKITFQFEPLESLKGLAIGLDTTIDFTLSVLNLKKVDTDLYLFEGPWVFSIMLNP